MWQHYKFFHPKTSQQKPRIAASACLLGENVRYDGGNKLNEALLKNVSPHAELHPVCPEVAIGLGVPRQKIRLYKRFNEIRAQGVNDSVDVTSKLAVYADKFTLHSYAIDAEIPICGFILKSKSPSCGAGTTAIYDKHDNVLTHHNGVFADRVLTKLPWIPVCDENYLHDTAILSMFLFCTYIVQDWYFTLQENPTITHLTKFHHHHMQQEIEINAITMQQLEDMLNPPNDLKLSGRERAFRYLSIFIQDLYYYGSK